MTMTKDTPKTARKRSGDEPAAGAPLDTSAASAEAAKLVEAADKRRAKVAKADAKWASR